VSTPPSTNQADLRLRVLDRVLRRMGPPVGDRTPQQPPALVITAEHDPLREEARRYAQRLRAEGTPARYTDYVGMTHGFLSFPGLAGGARQALAEMCHELADVFRTSSR
jgi:acetyl esterase/lipase